MTEKIRRFLAGRQVPTPCVVLDLDIVAEQFDKLRKNLPLAEVYYAVKANPAPEVVSLLHRLGARFDVASVAEIDLCLELGIDPSRLSYGNTIKKTADIAWAYRRGIRLFAFDSEAELDKLASAAPGSRVFCRLLLDNAGAHWPLNRKFGCEPDMAVELMAKADRIGLDAYGLSFHLGSQQVDPNQWDAAVGTAATVFRTLSEQGVELSMLNLGGGFPVRYREALPEDFTYADAVSKAMTRHFGNRLPVMVIEPGRYVVADAGVLETEVVLISRKGKDDPRRWVFLDVGRFGGLGETEGEAIQYRITTDRDGSPDGPVILAGPTCDSADILYEHSSYAMPLDLEIGDRVRILSTGAYTNVYATQGFNGFGPPAVYYI